MRVLKRLNAYLNDYVDRKIAIISQIAIIKKGASIILEKKKKSVNLPVQSIARKLPASFKFDKNNVILLLYIRLSLYGDGEERNTNENKIKNSTSALLTRVKKDGIHYLDGRLVSQSMFTYLNGLCLLYYDQLLIYKVKAITKHFGKYRCVRCLNTRQALFLSFFCLKCKKNCVYCLQCFKYGRLTSCQSLYHFKVRLTAPLKLTPKFNFPFKLTPHQKKASDEIKIKMLDRHGLLLVHAVCGAGKTEMLYSGIYEALTKGKRIALATPRQDVIKELLPRFKAVFTDLSIVCLYGNSEDCGRVAPLTLCTTHQLIHYKQAFDVMIIDEVDAFPYHADPLLIKQARRALKKDGAFIYLSATPRKSLLREKPPLCFVPIRYHGHPLPVPSRVQTSFKNTVLPMTIEKDIDLQRNNHRQLLIFIATIQHGEQLLILLKRLFKDEKIALVYASDEERMTKVSEFRLKDIDILITTTILERGVTFPSVDVFVLRADHHVFDEAALVQIAGRAGRSKDDPTGDVHFYYEINTTAINQAIKSIQYMNQLGGLS